MKQVSRKLTLVLLSLLSLVLLMFGTLSLRTNANAEDNAANATTVSSEWYEFTYTENSLEFRLNGNYRDYFNAHSADVKELGKALLKAGRNIVVENILNNQTPAPATYAVRATSPTFDPDSFDWGDTGLLRQFKDYVTERLSDPQEFVNYVNGDYDMLIDYAIGQYVQTNGTEAATYEDIQSAIQNVVETAHGNVMNAVTEEERAYYEELLAPAQQRVQTRVENVQQNGGEASISLKQLLASLRSISVDGNLLFSKEGALSEDGLRYLLKLMPRPSAIANMTDAQLADLISANVTVDTTYGEVSCDLTFGFYGSTSAVKKAAQYIADHVAGSLTGNDVNLSVVTPQTFAKVFSKFVQSTRFSDENKNLIFSVFGKTVDEIYDKVTSYTFDQLIDLLRGHDFQYWFSNFMDAEFINSYFGSYIDIVLDRPLTNGDIDRVIDKLHNFFAPKMEKLEEVTVEQVKNWLSENIPGFDNITVPEKAERMAEKLLSLAKKVDWAKYDSAYIREILATSTTFNDTVEDYLDRLANYDEYYDLFMGFVEKVYNYVPERFKDGTIVNLYNGNSKFSYSGTFTVDIERIVKKAASVLRNRGFETMAGYVEDAITLFNQLTYTVDLSLELDFTNLYKVTYMVGENVVREGFLPAGVNGETIETLANLKSVDGRAIEYWAIADGEKTSVSAMPANDVTLVAVLEKIQIEKPTASEESFTYNGELQTYLPVGFDATTMSIENNEQTNAGSYSVTVSIADPENYEWTNGTAEAITFDWTIGKIALEQPALDKTELTYGETGVTLSGFDETKMTMSEEDEAKLTATNAGEYSITIALADSVNYEWTDGTTDDLTLTWTIKKAVLNAPTAKEQEYIYNTEEQTFALENFDEATMTVAGNKQTKAGTHTVTVGLVYADNYEWAEGAQTSFEWIIKRAQLEQPTAATSKVYTYSGSEQDFLFLTEPDEATMAVAGNKQTDAGTYQVTVTIKEIDNYEWKDGTTDPLTFDWTIDQKSITVTAELSETEFTYDGTEHTVTIALTGKYKDYATFSQEGMTGKNAGEYTATATLSLKEAYQKNYKIGNENSKIELAWVINKAEVAAPTNAWSEQASFVYGETVTVEYTGFASDTQALFTEVVYTVGETAFADVTWDAGNYTVTATFTLKDAANYRIADSEETSFSFEKTISVTAKTIDLTGAEWNIDPTKLTYNGAAQDVSVSITLDGTSGLSDAEKEAARNATITALDADEQLVGTAENGKISLINAGTYYVTAQSANKNYTFTNVPTAEITVAQKEVSAVVEWSATATFTYDGTEHTVSKVSAIVLDVTNGDYTVGEVTGNKATDAGSYKASLEIKLLNANYKFANGTDTYTSELNWTIAQATATVSVNWNYTAPLDFGAHELDVEVTVTPDTLVKDTDYKVEITGNSANTAGTHTANVKVTLLNKNYKFESGETFEGSKEWVIKEEIILPGDYEANHEFELGTTEVKLTIKEGNVSTTLTATAGKEANFDLTAYEEKLNKIFADKEFELGAAYDIHFENADGEEMNVSGKFEVRLMIPENLRSLPDDQLAVIHIEDNGNISAVDGAHRDGNEMVFETNGFSVYAVISLSPVEPTPEPAQAMPWWAIALLVVVAVLLLIALILLIMFVKNAKAEEPTEDVAEEEVEEPVETEEAPVEETPAEESTEEPVEEPAEEEAQREPIYIPVYPDAPVEKTPYVPVGGNEPETEIAPVAAPAEENMTILDKSFTARLTQADSTLQTMYSELKNYILSYKYVRSRVSWGYDSFNKGRSKLCKLQIKGKSLIMYIALDPQALDAKYHHKDVSDVAKYADVPTKLKVRSARSLKYAKELIDMIMKNMEIEQGELESLNYVPVYKSVDELIAAGEIKKKEVAAPDFWNMDAADVVENSPELPEVELPDLDEEE